jgi:hypothetical protein
MRRLALWGLTGALAVGLIAGRALAGDDDSPAPDTNPPTRQSSFRWSPAVVRMFQLDAPKPAPKKPAPAKKEVTKKPSAAKPAAPAEDPAVAGRNKAEAALMRRLEVCDRLKEIALRSNDAELFHRAELLDEQARAAYAQHAGELPAGAAAFESDEKTLARHLGTPAQSADRLTTGTATAALGTTPNDAAAGKEVNR